MSNCPGVKCDRCGKRALCDGDHPSGWSTVRVQVPRPFCDTGHLDLCDVCTAIVYNTISDKPGMPIDGKDPRGVLEDALIEALEAWKHRTAMLSGRDGLTREARDLDYRRIEQLDPRRTKES